MQASPPGTRNPRDANGTCVYQQEGTDKRCIVGELLHRMRMPIPQCDSFKYGHNDYVDRGYMGVATKRWLGEIQSIFDCGIDCMYHDKQSPTWRDALKMCRKEGLL